MCGPVFLREWWTIDMTEAPEAVAIVGSDLLFQPYTDERVVQRIYEVTLAYGVWKMWRDSDDPFTQRFSARHS